MLENGAEVAAEIVWSGTLAAAFTDLPAGSEWTAYVAMFLTFQHAFTHQPLNGIGMDGAIRLPSLMR